MKKIVFLVTMVSAIIILTATASPVRADVRFNLFYSSLSPYGEWVDCSYGHVWRPINMHHGWRPYMYGRWIWTDYGWYWVSDEPFGWATFHYGRWQYDDYYGWIWIPDDVWGPAWVEWRYSDDYIGWAPLAPTARFSFSVGLSFGNNWRAPVHYWNFVPCRSFTSVRVVDYVQPIERTRRFFGNTRGARHIEANGGKVVNRGVGVEFIERNTRTRIERAEVVSRSSGSGDNIVRSEGRQRIEVYRPNFERGRAEETTIDHRADVRGGYERTPMTGSEQRTEQLNRSSRHSEFERRADERRSMFNQKRERMQNRQTDINRSYSNHDKQQIERRDSRIERRMESKTPERRFETNKRSGERETPKIERAPSEGRQRRKP